MNLTKALGCSCIRLVSSRLWVWLALMTAVNVAHAAGIPWINNQAVEFTLGPAVGSDMANLNGPNDVAIDAVHGKLYVADYENHRVLRFSYPVTANSPVAEAVFGQADFTSIAPNRGGAPGNNTMKYPAGVAVASNGDLWVLEAQNFRAIKIPAAYSAANGAAATVVLGQADMNTVASASGSVSQSTFAYPGDISIDSNGALWVADVGNNRVLRFDNVATKTSGAPADGVLGQLGFFASAGGTAANTMSSPYRICTAGTTLWVVDYSNNRVLRFDNAGSKSNGANADGVLGQLNFVSGLANQGGIVAANSFSSPYGVAADAAGTLYVSDAVNGRILIFSNAAGKTNGASADNCLGAESLAAVGTLSWVSSQAYDDVSHRLEVIKGNQVYQYFNAYATTTTITSSPNPSTTVGATVTFTATVTTGAGGPTATGTVNFKEGSTIVGSGALDGSGVATFATTSLGDGDHLIVAEYVKDSSHQGSFSAELVQWIGKFTPTITVTSSANPSSVGDAITFTATVTRPSGTLLTPTGSVSFSAGGTTQSTPALSSGIATWTTSALAVGTHSVAAVYNGDANFRTVTSSTLDQVVHPPGFATLMAIANSERDSNGTTDTFVKGSEYGNAIYVGGYGSTGLPYSMTPAVKFNLSSLTGTITAATLKLRIYDISSPATLDVVVSGSADDSWTDTTTPPSMPSSTIMPSIAVYSSVGKAVGEWISIDVTDFIKAENAGDRVASFVLEGSADPETNDYIAFHSWEAGAGDAPTLEIQTALAPTVTSISPALGISAGGTPVTITGTAFTGATAVTIGGTSVSSIVVVNDTTITGVTPSGTPGTRDVGVTTPIGTGTGAGLFTYVTAPGAPTIGTATAGNAEATVTFTAPASTGGASITGYTVTSNPGSRTATGSASPITVTGLTNGTAYTFTVTATNSAALTSSPSASSNSVTPKATQTIAFDNPGAQNFGTTPTLSATTSSGLTVTFTSDDTSVATITSGGMLTFVSTGTAKIRASQAGNGTYFPATDVVRNFSVNAIAPGSPTIGTAIAGNAHATVTFTAPAFNGGTYITSYTVTSSGGQTASGPASPITVAGLTNGVAYTFTVTATNAAGTGMPSAASGSVTPMGTTTTTVASSVNPSTYGAPLTFTATVIPSSATGIVTFNDGSTTLGTAALSSGTATLSTSALSVGGHPVSAVYAGDLAHTSSTSSLLTQTVEQASSTTTVASSLNPSTYGATVTYTATVSPSAATGTVIFKDGSTTLGTGTLSSGTAAFSTSALTVSSHSISAAYVGDDNYTPSTSSTLTQTVNAVVPGAPVIGTATAGDARATVAFTAPAFDGGATITSYTVTSIPGGITATGSASPITVTGLTDGTAYTFTARATNAAGTGLASAVSNSVTPATIVINPAALPDAVLGVAYGETVTASGGASPYAYGLTGTLPAGLTLASAGALTGTPTGLGTYSFTVTATDANGTAKAIAYSIKVGARPVVTTSAGVTAFTEADNVTATPVAIDDALSVSDIDNATLASGTVSITGGFQTAEDLLAFANDGSTMGNITGSYNSTAGVVTLTSSGAIATTAQWQAALRSVTYTNLSETPDVAERTIGFTVNDGTHSSNVAAKTLAVVATDDTPTGITLSNADVLQSAGSNAVVGTLNTTDIDSTTFTYTLANGSGSTDNAFFGISGSSLCANNAASLSAGSYSVRIEADDGAGGLYAKSFTLTVIDDVPPAAPLITMGSSITANAKPAIAGTAEPLSIVRIYDGVTLLSTVNADGSGAWSFTPGTELTDGAHPFTANATDGSGNTSPASTAFTVTIDTIVPAKPVVTTASGNTTVRTPRIVGMAESLATVKLYDGTTLLGTETADGTGAWSFALTTALTDGVHTLTVTATDAAGNVSAASSACTLIVGTAPAITTEPAGRLVTAGSAATLTATATGTATLSYQWQRSADGTLYTELVSSDDSSYTLASATVANSGYYRVVVSNVFGTATSAPAYLAVTPTYAAPAPDGYASATTGGSAGTSVVVLTAADFRTHATSTTACVITVVGQLSIGSVNVASNKTIQGADADAALVGNLSLNNASNVIIRGLNMTNPGTTIDSGAYTDGGDALTISGSSRVFVTHCTFFDCADHHIKISAGADNVTISWCEFYASAPALLHRYSVQIGSTTESQPLHVTLHHNWWTSNMDQRMPFSSFGFVHQYNNYVNATGNTAGCVISDQAQFLSERNVYASVASPLTKTATGKNRVIGNLYTACTGTAPDAGTDTVFTPPYSYELLPATDVATEVTTLAGNTAGASTTDAAPGTATIAGPTTAIIRNTAFTLTATPSGFAPSSYQWRFNNVNIDGATSPTYTVAAASASPDLSGIYTVAISIASGDTVVSTPVVVTINDTTSELGKVSASGGGGAPGWLYLSTLAALVGIRRVTSRSGRKGN